MMNHKENPKVKIPENKKKWIKPELEVVKINFTLNLEKRLQQPNLPLS